MSTIEQVLSALANPVRREAMRLLMDGHEMCLCEFMDRLGIAQSSMSRHMTALKTAGLVIDRRDAQWVRYRRNASLDQGYKVVLEAVLAAPETARSVVGGRSAA
ncbi:ArsR family transcriptional regulator [Rhodobium orientis]|uniref:Transcriptional regulator n=1 Tax=Rhodobium orientis TaxID=34017 RepID=A0A327JTV1_9HYPH|nr:metalloregulator ArsR/SmtB family transcription factor [Rhodobium orientis]MBB4303512.1 ArsR family transcriptional regulator [Rhodobium orientis]MBK5950444.1 transcriptional regulator [Rhodobium orientis]RAI28332.1 transcriptional regulator [Rhodobium orientis]